MKYFINNEEVSANTFDRDRTDNLNLHIDFDIDVDIDSMHMTYDDKDMGQ